ncbi:low molecular weight protein-tyrosine-phosphatase [Mesorhizobium xinjiangense]|uniref:low molecular weight protein-tyrosine-phosphatase n=1 Tax=Mesorhizobium xinjiangense TaxID=2678685 RepID=UPI0012EE40A1|nr:low molecular weight protein-tyrosine-phosphatase [Mesorhizobium xinjiangense]
MANPCRSILFVCLGNICRSPLAEGVFRAEWQRIAVAPLLDIASAGTGAWHAGAPPDPRSVEIAAANGIDISGQRARRIDVRDFDRHDLILGMDRTNVETLRAMAPADGRAQIHLFMEYALGEAREVPDPYYGGAGGFADVYRMIRTASERLAERLAGSSSGHASSMT